MNYKFGKPDDYGDFPYLYCGQWNDSNLNDLLNERLPEYYNMQLVDSDEIDLLAELVNQGIDSHLEAVTSKDSGKVIDRKIGDTVVCRAFEFVPDKQGMICLIRRLREYLDVCEDSDKWDIAYNLLSCIFETLQIEYSV